jgi:hypothetical protein
LWTSGTLAARVDVDPDKLRAYIMVLTVFLALLIVLMLIVFAVEAMFSLADGRLKIKDIIVDIIFCAALGLVLCGFALAYFDILTY